VDSVKLVKGKITFEEETPPFSGATLYVRLENVTDADIPSQVVADYVQQNVAFDPNTGRELLFSIAGDAPDSRVSYAVRVHIDIDGDGAVSRGDLISMQSYPVITFGHPKEVSILVQQVK
jgi:uncharacterized lipoprotein YbaY